MRKIGAVDIGGTKTAVALVREDGVILGREQWPTEPALGFPVAVRRIRNALGALSAGGNLAGIGLACPGPFDPRTHVLGLIGTLPGWQGCDLVTEMENAFGVSAVMENDADAAAMAEYFWGSGKGSERFLYVTVSTGIGGGLILSGDIYRGAGGAHPEIGHLLIDASGPLCYCGLHGCWEALASGTALAAWVREESGSSVEMSAEQICAKAQTGDPLALRAVAREAQFLGLGLANLVTALVPDTISLGGGVMKSSSLFLPHAITTMRSLCTQVPGDLTRVTIATLGGDAGLLGAASSWLHRYP